jgi:hypothetical protein
MILETVKHKWAKAPKMLRHAYILIWLLWIMYLKNIVRARARACVCVCVCVCVCEQNESM